MTGSRRRPMRPHHLLLPLLLGFTSVAAAQWGGPAPVRIATIAETEMAPTLEIPGTALPLRRTQVGAPEAGRVVERVRGYFSAPVKAGDVLIRLDDTAAKARLAQAKARAAQAKAVLDEALAGERAETLAESRAEFRRAEAASREAAADRKRIQDLFERGAATQTELDAAVRGGDVAQEELKAARSRLDLLVKGKRKEVIAAAEAAHAAELAAVALAQKALDDHAIRAPYDGIVDEVLTEVGAWLDKGNAVLQLLDISKLDLAILVPEDQVHRVPMGASVTCEFPAGARVIGKVVSIGGQATLQGRTVPVMVRVANEDRRFKSQMSARVWLPVEAPRARVAVPKNAVLRDASGATRVMMVVDGKAQPRPVKLGIASGHTYEVLEGLAPGDVVVTHGNERLQPGQQVAPEDAPPAGEAQP